MTESNEPHSAQNCLAGFVADFCYGALPADIKTEAKYRVLDWIGSALAGVRKKPALSITDLGSIHGRKNHGVCFTIG